MDARTRISESSAVERLAALDAALFSDPAAAADRLGWIGLPDKAVAQAPALAALAASMRSTITDVVLLGMGGSSLAPLVLAQVIGPAAGSPLLHVVDTTSPVEVNRLLGELWPASTLVVVSSKSGVTVEPLSLAGVFREWMRPHLAEQTGSHFVALTDPGSPLETYASRNGFAAVFPTPADVGGRYAALSPFAMVPAAIIGIDTARVAASALAVERACRLEDEENPGAALGAWLADAYAAGRDKVTIVCSERLAPFGLWVEQLVAESTGKGGCGLLPVLESAPGDPRAHGSDRMTVILRGPDDASLESLRSRLPADEPFLETTIDDVHDLGGEFVRWEWAVALFCALNGIEPFDQPNVEEAKAATTAILSGDMPAPEPQLHQSGLAVTAHLDSMPEPAALSIPRVLSGLLEGAGSGDYLAVLAYLPYDERLLGPLRDACATIAAARKIAVTFELGPRYLHSTGQYHKGGPGSGRFLMITERDAGGPAIPGQPFDLAALHRAQAAGDFVTLAAHHRPVVRVDLPQGDADALDLLAANLRHAAG